MIAVREALRVLAQPRVLAVFAAVVAVLATMVGVRRKWPRSLAVACWLALGPLLAMALSETSWSEVPSVVRFVHPTWLVGAAAVAIMALTRLRFSSRSLSRIRARTMWAFASLAALMAAVAVADPEWGHRVDRLTVIVAADHSRSMELVGSVTQRVRDEEARATSTMGDEDRIGRVVFGAEAATEDPAHPRTIVSAGQDVSVGSDATDIGAAIRRSLAEIPSESAGRIVLFTDGAANRGDALGAAAAASAAGVPVDIVPLRTRPQRNVRVQAVRAPVSADEGETFDLRIVTESTVETDADVRVTIDGHLQQTGRVHIRAGEDVVTLRQTAPPAGLRRYEIEVSPVDPAVDAIVQDNRGGTYLRVRGPASVLIVEGDPGHGSALSDALHTAAFRTEERGPNSFPADLAELAAYDLVVLSDVAARFLSPEQMEHLATYARDLGGGVLLMGGDRSMGPGGYSRTPVEEISPVSFDMRQERRRASLAEVIAIDFSGSMSATVPTGQTKLQLANEAASRSAMLLGAGDRLGVMHVDTMPHWSVPLQAIGGANNLQSIVATIRAVGPSGGGIIIPVTLTEAYRALGEQHSNLRHLLLFADGADSEEIEGQWTVVAEAFRHGITTSVVSMGRGGDTPELEHLSREGHGRFYLVGDATRLPAVFAQETVLAARSSIREEEFRPTVGAPDAVTRGIDFAAGPPLRGWVVTIPKPRASVLLRGLDNDPILATWQVGVGRVGAFMSDAKDRWGAEWLVWPDAVRLWAELARSLARRADPLVRVDADATGGTLHIHADARTGDGYADSLRRLSARVQGPDGQIHDVPLVPVGAGTYAAELPLQRPGAYPVAVRDEPTGAIVANGGALLLEGEEMRPATDPLLLDRIISLTGGRTRTSLETVFRDRVGLRRTYTPLAPVLLAMAAALMFLALVARRLAMPEFVSEWLDGRKLRTRTRTSERSAAAQSTVAALLARRAGRARLAKDDRDSSESERRQAPPEPTWSPPPVTPRAEAPSPQVEPPPAAPVAASGDAEKGTGSSNLDALLARRRKKRG